MNSIRSQKATYVAAFLLGALIALLFVAPARSAEPDRRLPPPDAAGVAR